VFANYVCDGQLSIFDIFENIQEKTAEKAVFDPIEAYALLGSFFKNGESRIFKFFNENHSTKEKSDFLKKEYGIGGLGIPSCSYEPCMIVDVNYDAKGNNLEYLDEEMNKFKLFVSWSELAEAINRLIKRGSYKANIT